MTRSGDLLVLAVILLQQGEVKAFKWGETVRNGSTVHVCAGTDVSFRWPYVSGDNETVMADFLFSERNGTLASRFGIHSVSLSSRVVSLPDPGMILTRVRVEDSGVYGMHVKMMGSGSDRHIQVANLMVSEPPILADATLQLKKQPPRGQCLYGNENCNSITKLKCGPFKSPGSPPLSVRWTDPQGNAHMSSKLIDGYFSLSLPIYPMGGNYTCTLILHPEVTRCWKSDVVPLMTSASIFLETADTKVEAQAGILERLQLDMQQVKLDTEHLRETSSVDILNKVGEQMQQMENSTQNLSRELDAQRSFVEDADAVNREAISQLKRHLTGSLQDLRDWLTESLQENVYESLSAVEEKLAKTRTALEGQDNITQVLDQRTRKLESQLQDFQEVNAKLQQGLVDAVRTSNRQNSAIVDLENELQERMDESVALRTVIDKQQQDLQNLWSNVSSLQTRVQLQEASSETLQTELDELSSSCSSKIDVLRESFGGVTSNMSSQIASFISVQAVLTSNLRNVSQVQTARSDDLQRQLTELEARVTNDGSDQSSAVSANLTSLWRKVSTVEGKYQDLLPRVQTIETNLDLVRHKANYVRLVGGSNSREGRVEIRVGDQWGTVCDDSWDSNDAKVICSMLGYLRSGAQSRGSAAFGQGTGPIVLDDVNCNGSEQDIRACPSRVFGTHNCGHGEDAGVICPS